VFMDSVNLDKLVKIHVGHMGRFDYLEPQYFTNRRCLINQIQDAGISLTQETKLELDSSDLNFKEEPGEPGDWSGGRHHREHRDNARS